MYTIQKKIFGLILGVLLLVVSAPSFATVVGGVLTTDNSYKNITNSKTKQVNVFGTDKRQEDSFVNVVKGGVNWVLGILALIALLYLMWGGFQMVTSGGDDDAYGKGFTILKHGATGLILIGVAWFVISIIFWLVSKITDDPGLANTQI